jgi:Ser/Thr protein kinase RdoA (MazF antagonist)
VKNRFPNIDFDPIISGFNISGNVVNVQPTGDGHINDTFLVKTEEDECPDFILQRINHSVFKDVPKLMDNMQRVILHLKQKSKQAGRVGQEKETLVLVLAKDGRPYVFDSRGDYWRCFEYCQNSCAPSGSISLKLAYEGGKALGKFQAQLTDLPGGPLHDTIPDFHNLTSRMAAFEGVVEKDEFSRLKTAQPDVDKFLARKDEMLEFDRLARNGSIPWRITHNDTKFNNILFDKNQEAICLIDLDTVMNGTVLYDFGDALRTLGNTAEEDETDLSKVGFNMELFGPFAKGYISEANVFLTEVELKYLAFSAKFLTYIIAIRFLTDWLSGDVYYKTTHPEHNLERARNQMRLLECMEEDFEEMEAVIKSCQMAF